jgi:hypothetical protein
MLQCQECISAEGTEKPHLLLFGRTLSRTFHHCGRISRALPAQAKCERQSICVRATVSGVVISHFEVEICPSFPKRNRHASAYVPAKCIGRVRGLHDVCGDQTMKQITPHQLQNRVQIWNSTPDDLRKHVSFDVVPPSAGREEAKATLYQFLVEPLTGFASSDGRFAASLRSTIRSSRCSSWKNLVTTVAGSCLLNSL